MGRHSQITYWCHEIIKSQAKKDGIYIDATVGKGKDTLFLCELAGESGRVLAFDIQEEALEITRELLRHSGFWKTMCGTIIKAGGYKKENNDKENINKDMTASRLRLILDGHEHMDQYAETETIDVICFNFGYLPGGDHNISTKPETSITAIEKGLKLLKSGGMMSLCIYSGGDTGFEEKEAVLSYVRKLSSKEYTVIVNEYYNRENHPPMPVFIFKS